MGINNSNFSKNDKMKEHFIKSDLNKINVKKINKNGKIRVKLNQEYDRNINKNKYTNLYR